MKKLIIGVLLLYLNYCHGQRENCISNFIELQTALLSNLENQYRIVSGYLPPKSEINPVCVTSYYYIGINSSDTVKQNCPSNKTSNKDEAYSGCSKWIWCSNSFYAAFDLGKLQDFSLHIIRDETSEVELELPPLCNVTSLYDYFLRITKMLYSYTRNISQLDKEAGFIGYVASYTTSSKLEKITYSPNHGLLGDDKDDDSADLYVFYAIILCTSLMALPTCLIIFMHIVYLECTDISSNTAQRAASYRDLSTPSPTNASTSNPTEVPAVDESHSIKCTPGSNLSDSTNNLVDTSTQVNLVASNPPSIDSNNSFIGSSKMTNINLHFIMFSFVFLSVFIAIPAMLYFQHGAITNTQEWYYFYPYTFLLICILMNLFISVIVVYKIDNCKNHDRLLKWLPFLVEAIFLWIIIVTMQLVSWHLVFIFCGLALNFLRALLYTVSMGLSAICAILFLAIIIKITVILVVKCCCSSQCCKKYETKVKSHIPKFSCKEIAVMLSLFLLLICTFTYSLFIFQVTISVSNKLQTLDEISKSIIPTAFLILIGWLLRKVYLDPTKMWQHIKSTSQD